jgi:type II secretory ATPase GspE/PulE/Tfp pilus assembly ATPase PilB-like protein
MGGFLDDTSKLNSVADDLYRNGQEAEVRSKAGRLGIGYADLRKSNIPNEVLEYLSRDEVIKFKAIPLKSDPKKLALGIVDPAKDISLLVESLKQNYSIREVPIALISEQSYLDWLPRYNEITKMTPLSTDERIDLGAVSKINSFEELADQLAKAPIQDLLKMILFVAFNVGASDIHIEPRDEYARIRYRLDGTLHEVATLDGDRYSYVLSQVELNANIKLNAPYPQGGRFSIRFNEKDLGVRIETMPSLHGDDIVMRLFNTQSETLKLSELGFSAYALPRIDNAISRPHGMILVVGPTGAGKTTTIYSILNQLNTEDVKIITLEDPVEYEMPGTTQSQINDGESFSERLKAVLREDPDIIMVGEIREASTAETAIQAALTGHLLISTLHANDAVTAVTRLYDMVGDPTMITAATNIIIAQRLLRKICPTCREAYEPTPYERQEFDKIIAKVPPQLRPAEPYKFEHGAGCAECQHIGYKGRLGIFEVLEMTGELQKLINERTSIFELREAANSLGFITMEQDGVLKALAGDTTITEVLRAVRE